MDTKYTDSRSISRDMEYQLNIFKNSLWSSEKLCEKINNSMNLRYVQPQDSLAVYISQKSADAHNAFELLQFKGKEISSYSLVAVPDKVALALPDCFSFPVKSEIEVCENARVIFIADCPDGSYFKGQVGMLNRCVGESLEITLDNGTAVEVFPKTWRSHRIIKESAVYAELTQFPIDLAYARSLEESRELLIDKVHFVIERSSKRVNTSTLLEICNLCVDACGMSFSEELNYDDYYDELSAYQTPRGRRLDLRETCSQ